MTEQLAPSIIKRLTKELCELQETPCEGIRVLINERNIGDVQVRTSRHYLSLLDAKFVSPCMESPMKAELEGPTGTPFESGLFRLRLVMPSDFPQSPPKGDAIGLPF